MKSGTSHLINWEYGDYGVLHCANCAGGNLHHVAIDIHNRPHEDGTTTSSRVIAGRYLHDRTVPPGTENPSCRRDGLCVCFQCEACDAVTILSIAQHKGETHIGVGFVTANRATILEAAAQAMSEGCCQMFTNGECCMSGRAREVFTAINEVGGPSLEECEAIARGEVRLVRETVTER